MVPFKISKKKFGTNVKNGTQKFKKIKKTKILKIKYPYKIIIKWLFI